MDPPPQKRPRVVYDTNACTFRFFDADGMPIPPNELFSHHRNLVVTIILAHGSAGTLLRLLERAGTSGRNFVQRQQLWRRLFFRDFPDQYANALAVDQPALMRRDLRERLDAHSLRPGRLETYWKRLYELHTRADLVFTRPRQTVSIAQYANLANPIWLHETGRLPNEFQGLVLHRSADRRENAVYVRPGTYNSLTNFGGHPVPMIPKEDDHPTHLLRVALDTGRTSAVAYDPSLLGNTIQYRRGAGTAQWRGLYGFTKYEFRDMAFWRSQVTNLRGGTYAPQLVSARCAACGGPAHFREESARGRAYCSNECQAAYYEKM